MREVLSRNEDAIERLVQRMKCVPRILAIQNARLGRPLNEHDLADLTQDASIIIWKKLDRYAGQAALEGWLYRLCCLELMNFLRKKKRRVRITGRDYDEESDAPGDGGHRMDPWEYEDLYRGLEELPEDEADVISQKHFEERTFDQIGARLGISPNTAKTRYYRGLQNLQQILERGGSAHGSPTRP